MGRRDLSILIPARNERWLKNTVDDILGNIEADTEIIVVADGQWPVEPLQDHPRLTIVHPSESIGQRAATNVAAKISRARYLMKCDAHCSFDKGFDKKLIVDYQDGWTVVPRMYNLHVFDWRCKECGATWYQGPTPTKCTAEECKSKAFERVVKWQPRWNRCTDFMRFDSELHFQYWREYKKRSEAQGEICDLMSCVGACWFMSRRRYWEIDGMDERHGSWGQMGTELACKSWLSGGRMVVNKKTWFAHLFRTQGGDFGFPYPNPNVAKAQEYSRDLWRNGRWKKAVYPLQWLVDKFTPVPGWEEIHA